jgi:hypothetical protein
MTHYKDKLSKRELGELLSIIADALGREEDVSTHALLRYLDRFSDLGKSDSPKMLLQWENNKLFRAIDFLKDFATNEELREFLQVVYGKKIPYRLSKELLHDLGVGVMLSSSMTIEQATSLWNKRNEELRSLNIYQTSESKLLEVLNDQTLFPDGYSIGFFARKFHINLPKVENRELPIQYLLEKLFERPSSSKSIGRWGLPDQEKRKDGH